MILRFSLIVSLIALSSAAFAGANNGVLSCKSASGRTTLSGEYPIDFTSGAVILIVDGQSLTYVNQDKVDDAALNRYDLGQSYPGYIVKQFQPTLDAKAVALWVGVDSGKKFDENDLVLTSKGNVVRKSIPNGYLLKFRGTIDGVDPRNTNVQLPQIEVSCTLKYQI